MDRRGPYALLRDPRVYRLKTWLLSFGRASVRDYLARHLVLPQDARILDVACGTGRRSLDFGRHYWGVDCSLPYLAHGKRRHGGCFAVMDATAMAFPKDRFDLVLAVGLCHHLPDDAVRAAANEMLRVARPGGRAVVIDGILPPWSNPVGRVLFSCDRGRYPRPLAALTGLLSPLGYACECRSIPRSFPYQRAVFVARA